MKNKGTLGSAACFGIAAGVCVYMWAGLYAGAAALVLCSLTAFISVRFGRVWGFLPAAAGFLTAAISYREFLAECALCADTVEYLYALQHSRLYVPLADTAESALPMLLVFCGIICGIYTALGAGTVIAVMTVFSGIAGTVLGLSGLPVCVLTALTAGVICFGTENKKSLGLIGLTVLLTLPCVFISLPKAAPEGEASASGGLPLYLAESYEQPHCTKEQYAQNSAILKTLRGHGFEPALQSGYLLEATGADIPTESLTVDGGLIPQNACTGETDSESTGSFASGRFTVCRTLPENVFRVLTGLHEGDYLDCEGLYREYVYNAYGSLTAQEQALIEKNFKVDGTLPVDKKLEEIRKAVNSRLTVGNGSGSAAQVLSKGKANSEGYARVTVCLAKSCGIAAREVRGVYFGAFPQSGHAKLSEGEYRVWAEVYIDGAGWVVFETSPEYSALSPLLPEGRSTSAAAEDVSTAEQYVYAAAPPRTSAEIRTEESHKKPDIMWLLYPMGAAVMTVMAGRIRAVLRSAKRNSRSYNKALSARHFQGRQLTALALGAGDMPPEELAELAGGLLGERLRKSERAYERMRFSDSEPDKEAADTAEKFYREALRALRRQGLLKNLRYRILGLY